MSKSLESGREKWSRKIDFLLNVAGGSVGLANVWRFPYLRYKNGGGAFLIPYFICVIFLALPVFFLEVMLGQLTSQGVGKAWNIIPIMKGLGYAPTVIMFYVNIYYMMVLTWGIRYVVASFSSVLPWDSCNNTWNTAKCFEFDQSFLNLSSSEVNSTNTYSSASSVYEFWDRAVLNRSEGLHHIGSINWELFGYMLLGWIIVYFCIWKGVKWTTKVVYFTATFPLIMLVVLTVRGLTLEGANVGLKYYLTPNLTALLEAQVWADAATQVFFSYSLCSGVVVALGSYNAYKHDSYRDTFFFAMINSGTSIVSGFAVFSVLGHMAAKQNVSVADVAESGPGLVFQAYPRAISLLPLPQIWGALFFIMLFFLGLDSQFIGQESVITSIRDMKPSLFDGPWKRETTVAVICFIQFLAGIVMTTQGGVYVFNLLDNFAYATWTAFLVAVFECVAISWLYGADKFHTDISSMLGFRPTFYVFKYLWKYFVPMFTAILFIYALIMYKPLSYNKSYIYPPWAQGLGWTVSLSAILWIPGYAIYRLYMAEGGTISQRWKEVTKLPKKYEDRYQRDEIGEAYLTTTTDY